MYIDHCLLPVTGAPPLSFGSTQVKMADSCRMLTISGGAGAPGTSGGRRESERKTLLICVIKSVQYNADGVITRERLIKKIPKQSYSFISFSSILKVHL